MSWRLRAHVVTTSVVCAIPRGLAYRMARVAGAAFALVPSSRRHALTGNIAVALGLPESDPRVRRDVRRAFEHAMLNYVDLFGLERHDAPELVDSIVVDDWSPYFDAEAKGRGVVLFSAHLGNFDTVVQKLAIYGRRVLIPVENVEPPDFLDALRRRRALMGMDIVPVGPDTFRQMTAHVRSGGTVVIVCDRDIQGTGTPVTFFGHTVGLPQAALLVAIRAGAPLVGAFGWRFADNSIGGRFTPEIDLASRETSGPSNSVRLAVERGMNEIVSVIEREIRRDPGQWVVQQPLFARAKAEPAIQQPRGARARTPLAMALVLLARLASSLSRGEAA
jgi:lauroyl/myristoyl acyltransferase